MPAIVRYALPDDGSVPPLANCRPLRASPRRCPTVLHLPPTTLQANRRVAAGWKSRVTDGYHAETYGEEIADVYDDWIAGGYADSVAEDAAGFLAALAPGGRALELGHRYRSDRPSAGAPWRGGARHRRVGLRPGGRFVVEAFVPDPILFDRDQRVEVSEVGLDRVRLDVSMHDRTSQTVTSQHIALGPAGPRLYPARILYCWPSELNLICRLADLHLTDRYGGWHRSPYNSASSHHVSVYTKA